MKPLALWMWGPWPWLAVTVGRLLDHCLDRGPTALRWPHAERLLELVWRCSLPGQVALAALAPHWVQWMGQMDVSLWVVQLAATKLARLRCLQ
jgi:hypothetical protein